MAGGIRGARSNTRIRRGNVAKVSKCGSGAVGDGANRPADERAIRAATISAKPRRNDYEHTEQVKVFEWAKRAIVLEDWPEVECMFAIPNGGHRSKRTAARLKKEGVKAGVPDIFLPAMNLRRVSENGDITAMFGGLWIEMKSPAGRLSTEQRKFKLAIESSYCHVVCYSAVEAIEAIKKYLTNGFTEAEK